MLKDRLTQAQETIRQQRFKLKAFALLIEYAMKQLPEGTSQRIGTALFDLARHCEAEHPLTFKFNGQKIEEP